MDELLPCPHCGEPAEVFKGSTGYFHVTCSNEYCAKGKSTEELAIKSYNTRTPSKREVLLEEALQFIAGQNDLAGNWAVEKARAALGAKE